MIPQTLENAHFASDIAFPEIFLLPGAYLTQAAVVDATFDTHLIVATGGIINRVHIIPYGTNPFIRMRVYDCRTAAYAPAYQIADLTTKAAATYLAQRPFQQKNIQTVSLEGTAGFFRLSYLGLHTATIGYDATDASVKAAIEALANVTTVTVAKRSGGNRRYWDVTFDVPASNTDLMLAHRVWTVGHDHSGGTFKLRVGDKWTAAIAFNAAASAVKAAIELLPGVGTVTVSGTGAVATPWAIYFNTVPFDRFEIEGLGTALTGGTTFSVIKGPQPYCEIKQQGSNRDVALHQIAAGLTLGSNNLLYDETIAAGVVNLEDLDIRCEYGMLLRLNAAGVPSGGTNPSITVDYQRLDDGHMRFQSIYQRGRHP